MEILEIKSLIEKTLDLNKAQDIVTIDLKKKTYIADYMIIASGTSSRHIQSLMRSCSLSLKNLASIIAKLRAKIVRNGN